MDYNSRKYFSKTRSKILFKNIYSGNNIPYFFFLNLLSGKKKKNLRYISLESTFFILKELMGCRKEFAHLWCVILFRLLCPSFYFYLFFNWNMFLNILKFYLNSFFLISKFTTFSSRYLNSQYYQFSSFSFQCFTIWIGDQLGKGTVSLIKQTNQELKCINQHNNVVQV